MPSSKSILCTLGPSSLNAETIKRLGEMEVDLFRLNLSHTSVESLTDLVALIRANSDVPICLDSQGAQVRTGTLPSGSINLKSGTIIRLSADPTPQFPDTLTIYPGAVLEQLMVGDLVSVDFDNIPLQVIEVGAVCRARVLDGGIVGTNKAISIDRRIELPALTDQDRAAFSLCSELKIDQIALSFANRRSDIQSLRELVGDHIRIIAKIESRLGLENLDEILDAADAILIDRGDLAKEVPIEDVPFVQKEVIRRANEARVPVYVATNLLESMVVNPRPTRAEANDVINTLLDGADGLVLAAETAIGKYPVGCVRMIRSFINRHDDYKSASLDQHPWEQKSVGISSSLIAPHGGRLINQVLSNHNSQDLRDMPRLDADERQMLDIRQIALGSFSPLDGFMTSETLSSVLAKKRLPNGVAWPMPVLFQLPTEFQSSGLPRDAYIRGETVALQYHGESAALLTIEETFDFDLDQLALGWFGTISPDHPGVARIFENSPHFLAGKIQLLGEALNQRQPYELTPAQARQVFEHRQWERVVGFHTRNVPHRAHEYLQFTALEEQHCDGIFIHPVTGPKKAGDFSGEINLKTYDLLINHVYPVNTTVLGSFLSYPRYAGPREAVFTAICRQNFGCSHFIVGRDHTGVGDFYPPDASQRLFEEMGDIGIKPVFFEEVYYCQQCKIHVQRCDHGSEYIQRISGSRAREIFCQGEAPPDWYMREQVSRLILDELHRGVEVFST